MGACWSSRIKSVSPSNTGKELLDLHVTSFCLLLISE